MELQFCIECNNELENLSVGEPNISLDQAKIIHENCKKTGRFNGEMCSKIFILSDIDIIDFDIPFDNV